MTFTTINRTAHTAASKFLGKDDTDRLGGLKSSRVYGEAKRELAEKLEGLGLGDPTHDAYTKKDGTVVPEFTRTDKIIQVMEGLTPEEMAFALYAGLITSSSF